MILTVTVVSAITLPSDDSRPYVQGQIATSTHRVDIVSGASNPNNLRFYDPPYLEINKGDTITWMNKDASLHTVTSGSFFTGTSPEFDSQIMNPGADYQVKFNSTRTFTYFCTLHPFMSGTIDVK